MLGRVVGGEAREIEQFGDRPPAPMHRVPERPKIDDRIGEPGGEHAGVLGGIGGMGQDPLEPLDRQGQRGDVVVVEDAGGDERPQRLAAAIGQEGNLAREVVGQLVEGPAELVAASGRPTPAALDARAGPARR